MARSTGLATIVVVSYYVISGLRRSEDLREEVMRRGGTVAQLYNALFLSVVLGFGSTNVTRPRYSLVISLTVIDHGPLDALCAVREDAKGEVRTPRVVDRTLSPRLVLLSCRGCSRFPGDRAPAHVLT